MANLLLVDRDGRRRVRLELAAQRAGHHTYSAGSGAEALRSAAIYVPDAILLAGDLPDMTASAFIQKLRTSEKGLLRQMLVVTPDQVAVEGDGCVARAASTEPEAMLEALDAK
jgi:CheY-like chemotaxis protein